MLFSELLATALIALATSAAMTAAGTHFVLGELRRRAILDHPNERSSHAIPTPRGGGISVVAVLTLGVFWIGYATGQSVAYSALAFAIMGLALVSWIDDVRGLSVLPRLAAQFLATGLLSIVTFGSTELVFQGLVPLPLDRILAIIGWVWFINLFNFMDGIDGITGVESVSIALGLSAVAFAVLPDSFAPANAERVLLAAILAGAALGFLIWNWPPAKLFLGDVGSVPLGLAFGWILLKAAAGGAWMAALILPLFYLLDTTITLARRALRREPIWVAHRSHYYQRAADRFGGHAPVIWRVVLVNLGLIVLACLAEAGWRWPALLGAVTSVVGLLAVFAVAKRGANDA
jgi:UDP-N-acetylmuramyl pentapeptide phosphotransferase/UDP-N-acetylglucosamine-1-phosphate transferase